MGPYRYDPLPTKSHSIRLVRILPGSYEAEICCEIFNYELQQSRQSFHYEALSYVWGDASNKKRIFIAGNYLDVTVNLHAALRHLRDPGLDRVMWIDAICINQNDTKERSQQVGMMVKIYAVATRVVVWLGETIEREDEHCFAILRKIARSKQLQDTREKGARTGVTESSEESSESAQESSELPKELDPITENPTFVSLLQNPWFSRVWILQEAAAAQSLLFVYGKQQLPGKIFCEALISFQEHVAPSLYREIPSELGKIWKIISPVLYLINWDAYPGFESSLDILPLADMINMFQNQSTTDPRDKVFALLGLSSQETFGTVERPTIADYSKSWTATFSHVMRRIFGGIVQIKLWEDLNSALIDANVVVLGHVSSVTESGTFGKQQVKIEPERLNIFVKNWYFWDELLWECSHCSVYGNAKPVSIGDYIALVQGSERPCIIRETLDYFEVVAIATSVHNICVRFESSFAGEFWRGDWRGFFGLIKHYPYRFTLLWNWGSSVRRKKTDKSAPWINTDESSLVVRGLETKLENQQARLRRLYNTARLLDDFHGWQQLKRFRDFFSADWANLQKIKSMKDSYAMTYLARLERILDISCKSEGYGYEQVKHRCFRFSVCNTFGSSEKYVALQQHFQTTPLLKADWSNLASLSESQMVELLASLARYGGKEISAVLAELFPSHVNVTDDMLMHALEFPGPLVNRLLDLCPSGRVPTEKVLVRAMTSRHSLNNLGFFCNRFPTFNFLGLLHNRCPEFNFLAPAIEVLTGHRSLTEQTYTDMLSCVSSGGPSLYNLLVTTCVWSKLDMYGESWVHFFKPHAQMIADHVEQSDLCEIAISNPDDIVLKHLYVLYRHHALPILSYAVAANTIQDDIERIWKTEEDLHAWMRGDRTWLAVQEEAGCLPKELVLKSIRAYLLANKISESAS